MQLLIAWYIRNVLKRELRYKYVPIDSHHHQHHLEHALQPTFLPLIIIFVNKNCFYYYYF
jgi:hypothetical protein